MSAYAERLSVRSTKTEQALDVSRQVGEAVRRSGVRTGVCHVFVQHTTAGVMVNENADPEVLNDLRAALRRAVPDHSQYRHAEGNAPAHIRSVLTGSTVSVPVVDGDLAFGTWQGIFLIDFDGPRERHFVVTVIGE